MFGAPSPEVIFSRRKAKNGWEPARLLRTFRPTLEDFRRVLAVALTKINDRVFGRDLALPSVSFILKSLWKIMHEWPLEEALLLQQQDISGFFNAVPHKRIIDAVNYVLHRYLELEGLEGSTELSISLQNKDKLNRVFRGRLRAHTARHHVLVLQDIVMLTKFLSQNAYLSVGQVVLRQVQGVSMGSQLAPAFCSTVAMLMEDQWQRITRSMQTLEPMALHSRYVDNRIMVLTEHQHLSHVHQAFRRLDLYRPPLLLEDVEDSEILGFECCAEARQLRMLLPTSSGTIRGSDSACSTHLMLSNFRPRAELILRFTRPRKLWMEQLHDLQRLYVQRGHSQGETTRILQQLLRKFGR